MSDGDNVVALASVKNGVAAPDLREWLRSWVDAPAFDPENVRSITIVVEDVHGVVNCLPQGRGPMDGFRLVGLLAALTHRILHGKGIGL